MSRSSSLHISLDHLAFNYERLKELISHQKTLFMVKANAYGHGDLQLIHFAEKELGLQEFGVASVHEALRIRQELPDLKHDLYVFSDTSLQQYFSAYYDRRIIPVLHHLDDLRFFLGSSDFRFVPLCLKFNTGMNRLGFREDEITEVIKLLKAAQRKTLFHFCSHFACADQSREHPLNQAQYQKFQALKQRFKDEGFELERTSMANSGAIEQNLAVKNETHVRPGLMLYGPSALAPEIRADRWQGKMLSCLKTEILDIYPVSESSPVGYSGTLTDKEGTLVILPLGYGDGWKNTYSNSSVFCEGFEGKVFGRVSMDMTHVLFPSAAQKTLKKGQELELWGACQETFLTLAQQVKTIPYEILCGLSPRLPRIYYQ